MKIQFVVKGIKYTVVIADMDKVIRDLENPPIQVDAEPENFAEANAVIDRIKSQL